jgi:hypothetical protein
MRVFKNIAYLLKSNVRFLKGGQMVNISTEYLQQKTGFGTMPADG